MTQKEMEEICPSYIPDEKGCGFITATMFCRRPDNFLCQVYQMIYNGKISVSECNMWLKCHKAYQYLYVEGWDMLPKMQGKNLKIGKLIHKGTEYIYNNKITHIDRIFRNCCLLSGDVFPKELKDFPEFCKLDVDARNKLGKCGRLCSYYWDEYFNEDDIREIGIVKVMLDKLATLPVPSEPHLTEMRFELKIPDCPQINGVFDVLYAGHFDEFKATGNPDYYLTPHFLQSQLATYFLSEPNTKYCTMKIIRIPQLKSTGQYKDEQGEKFVERVKDDVDRRPGYYFIGLQDDGSWGKKFYRSEFDLDEVVERYKMIMRERRLAIKQGNFYKNTTQCVYPQPCNYLQRCECGGFSELLYYKKEIPK